MTNIIKINDLISISNSENKTTIDNWILSNYNGEQVIQIFDIENIEIHIPFPYSWNAANEFINHFNDVQKNDYSID